MELTNRVWQQILVLVLSCLFAMTDAHYRIGVGRADCTGPSAEITFMGYAKLAQKGCGIHLRQYARAYIFDDGNNRVAFVSVDACMMNHGIRKAVLEKLQNSFGNLYTIDNLILSGTHTHGTPGGFMMDVMLDIPNLGFVRQTFEALVDGIVRAIERAHNNMVEARIYISSGELLEANINRSPASYVFNPEEERARYKYNVDKDMVQIRFERISDKVTFGAINWFAVHPTSMNNTNCLVTSDNVGYASILLESAMDSDALPGRSNFVGAFASTNLGDVSPNIKGPRCINTGEPCEAAHSTCGGEAKFCIASGPGNNMVESTKIIASRLFGKAKELLSDQDSKEVTGEIKYIHQFVLMPNETALIQLPDGTTKQVRGCKPGMGYSFAAGTTDGPGEFDFTQATNTSNPFWNFVRDFIFPPTPDDVSCHAPKPILIMSGNIKLPYEWQPEVVATQIFMIGNVVLAAVPGEFTTMSGRRLRQAIKEQIAAEGGPSDSNVIIAGLSNVYTNYIATPEEYQLQRYEGASTIYGPHTLTIYLKIYRNLVTHLIQNKELPPQPQPYIFPDKLLTLVTPVLFDTSGWFLSFGDCLRQPPKSVQIGSTVSATFISGHPRNNLMHEDTFLTIERLENSEWVVVATDSSWETRFIWRRTAPLKGASEVDIQWSIGVGTKPGVYRIRHFGFYKYIFGGIYPYEGQSRSFNVI